MDYPFYDGIRNVPYQFEDPEKNLNYKLYSDNINREILSIANQRRKDYE